MFKYTKVAKTDTKAPAVSSASQITKDFHQQRFRTSWIPDLATSFLILGLLTSTIVSVILLASSSRQWTTSYPSRFYLFIVRNRATTQLIIQLLANGLALVNTTVLCSLINRATRLYWTRRAVTPNTMRLWAGICGRTMNWAIPLASLLPLIVFILVTAAPAAIWAGALTPVATNVTSAGDLSVPGYRNISNIQEWPSEIGAQGPHTSTENGAYTYSIGIVHQVNLMASAASASSSNDKDRQHAKIDHSGFSYLGRSYGVGAVAGLEDVSLQRSWVQGYSYNEAGFLTTVSCIHNTTTNFTIVDEGEPNIYWAKGTFPNDGPKSSTRSKYIGHGTDAIVAIGASRNAQDPRRMLSMASGKSYQNLNTTQCTFAFTPKTFQVNVGLRNRMITVTPTHAIDQFFPHSSNLTQALVRQFVLISVTQTTLYASALGNAFNQSISDYARLHPDTAAADLTLRGLENSLTAMADDMLVAYAGAQMYIQNDTLNSTMLITQDGYRIGADVYIYIIFAINAVISLMAVAEGVRTRNWRRVPRLDYMDPGSLLLASLQESNSKTISLDTHGKIALHTHSSASFD